MQRAKKYTLEQVAALLPWPDDLANKYSRGKLTLIAGCADYPGSLIPMNGGASLAALPRFRLRPQARTGGRARIAHADRAVRCMRCRARKRLVPWRPVIRWRSSSAAASMPQILFPPS